METLKRLFIIAAILIPVLLLSQALDLTAVKAEVDFSDHVREWDGFGFNYVEVSQTEDYSEWPQEYGGFSLLTENERQKICDMVFGKAGLKPGVVKMFLGPWHQKHPDGKFDHEKTTKWMRYFVKEGLKRTKNRGADLSIVTTLYGPPPWATKQKILRGAYLDPQRKKDLAEYIIDWVKWLRERDYPVDYISLHNEGEDWTRWPAHAEHGNIGEGHDYNLYWPPEQVVDFLQFMPAMLEQEGLGDIGIGPGETTYWLRFHDWGYANAIAKDEKALENLGLLTSHGFYSGSQGRWFGNHRSAGQDLIREKRPDIHAWTNSMSWGEMDANFLFTIHTAIYSTKVNAITPWAGIQRPKQWVGGDPNPGCAFQIDEEGNYKVRRGYYYYKQVCRAGQPGMAVARTICSGPQVSVIGFARNETDNPDAFVVINIAEEDKKVAIDLKGTESKSFQAFRTTDEEERYNRIGDFNSKQDRIIYTAPARSATTFYGK